MAAQQVPAGPRAPGPSLFPPRTAAATGGAQDSDLEIAEIVAAVHYPAYSIRNGRPRDVVPYLARPTIPAWARWVVIPGMSSEQGFACLDALIRSHIYHVHANAEPGWNDARIRKMGIVLGTMRAAMLVNYQIGPQDLIVGECAESPIAYVPAVAASRGPPAVAASAAKYVVRLTPLAEAPAQGQDPNAAERAKRAHLTNELRFTPAETAAIAVLIRCGQAALPLQGYALFNDGHHYLSASGKASFRAFQTVERQLWVGAELGNFFTDDQLAIRDWMWHKAGHPVVMIQKHELATSMVVKENLVAADLGSAAARLPAIEAQARAGAAYLALAKVVSTLWEPYGGSIGYSYLEDLMEALNRCGVGIQIPAEGVSVVRPGGPNGAQDVTVTFRRREDVVAEIQRVTKDVAPMMGVAVGFYDSYLEAQETTSRGGDTLMEAYSIKNLKKLSSALYLRGVEMHSDYRAYKAKRRADGKFDVLRFEMS